MNRILILEIKGGSATLLTTDGSFRTVAAQPGWEAGMELDAACLSLSDASEAPVEKTKRGRVVAYRRARSWLVAAAACLILLIGVQQGYRWITTVDASVEIAINPVVRMELNRLGHVVGLVGVNEDGRALLEQVQAKNGSAEEALRSILDQAIRDGYLSEEGRDVLIAVAGRSDQQAQQLEKHMADTANQVFEERDVRPKVSVRRHAFESARQMQAYIDALVAQGMELEEAYEKAGLGEDFLDLTGVRVHKNGNIEVRFTQDVTLSGKELITVTPAGGEAMTAGLVEVKDDRFSVAVNGLEAGAACTIRVTGLTDAQGAERTFTANFCNRQGRYARFEEADDREKLERLASGQFRVRFEDAWEGLSITGGESAVLLTRAGEAVTCEIAGYESGYWYFTAEDFPLNEIVSVAIYHAQARKGTETLYGDFLTGEAALPAVERTEYKADDGLVEIEFKDDFEWREGLTVTAVSTDGSRLAGTVAEGPDGDEMKVRFQGLREGQTYRLEISGTPFHITVTGKLIASDGAKVES